MQLGIAQCHAAFEQRQWQDAATVGTAFQATSAALYAAMALPFSAACSNLPSAYRPAPAKVVVISKKINAQPSRVAVISKSLNADRKLPTRKRHIA